MDKDLIYTKFSALEKKYENLEKENLYLRKLLNISLDEILEIPNLEVLNNSNKTDLNNDEKTINYSECELIKSSQNIESTQALSSQEKIQLFRQLFQGREDVFALRWEGKNGRAGYSPACANEWDRKVCRKPQIKCSECPNSQWLPITDQVIYDHLAGKKFIGVYPLNIDDSCRFLAIDFDKDTWEKDVVAFFKICQSYSIPSILEKSQSGNGAHVWIFFSQAISARFARSLGTALLSRTMQEHHTLRMSSYDRLFPNQDTLPKGGFGNLIALPLQGNRRKEGKSIFIDKNLKPHNDPWNLLLNIKPISYYEVMSLLQDLGQQGDIIDIRSTQTDEDKVDPWVTNNHKPQFPIIEGALPKNIDLVKANLIYVPVKELPSKLINQIKKIAAFHNPEFYRNQAMRLSTYDKPRIIYCAEEFQEHLGLPRGCEDDLLKLLNHYKININICDKTQDGKTIDVNFIGELRPEQIKAFNEVIPHRYGILCAATAFGKTVLAARIISERKTNTLILVHRQQLLEQWQERLSLFLGLQTKSIGTLSNGRNKLTGNIDIAMLQSLSKKEEDVSDEITKYGQIIVDECHHLSAFSFEKILKKANSKYILGLTATPIRKDGHHPIIVMQCGPIRFRSNNKIQTDSRSYQVSIRRTNFNYQISDSTSQISELYSALISNEERNEQIFNDVLLSLEDKRKPLLLTERIQHVEWLKTKFHNFVKNIFVLQGGMKTKERRNTLQKLSELPHDAERLIIATGQYIGEGFDDSQLDTLFLTLPISWHGKLQQYVGRLHRFHQNKKNILVYDYFDHEVPVLNKMHLKRLKKYKAMGYSIYEK